MTNKEFDNIVTERLETVRRLILSKGTEYIRNGNKFHNFDVAAKVANTHPLKALEGMRLKHDVSILDMFNDAAEGKKVEPKVFQEKLGDRIVYDILAELLFFREYEQ